MLSANAGQYFTADVAGEPVVVLRDGDRLRGFHNVCLHRAGPVASGCGKRQTLQCKYHGWTYRLDGSLLKTPGMEHARNFSADEMHLVPVQVEAWGPLVFVNLDLKAPPLAHFLDDLPGRVAFDYTVDISIENLCLALMIHRFMVVRIGPAFRLLNSRVLAWVGIMSYSLYLWQEPFLNHRSTAPLTSWPVNLVAAFACATASYYLIERPFMRMRRPPPAAAPP